MKNLSLNQCLDISGGVGRYISECENVNIRGVNLMSDEDIIFPCKMTPPKPETLINQPTIFDEIQAGVYRLINKFTTL